MMILRKTFDDDTSGIEVHDGDDTYRFQIDGDTAVYVGEDSVPQSIQDEIKNRGYAASVAYDVPGSIKEYVEANSGGGGTATETEVPSKSTSGYHRYVDENGTPRLLAKSPSSYQGMEFIAGDASSEPPITSVLQFFGPNASTQKVRIAVNGDGAASRFQVGIGSASLKSLGQRGEFDISGYLAKLTSGSVLQHEVRDVRNVVEASEGMVAYHDGTNSNTVGPAFYNGSEWKSIVDGSTIS